MSKTVITAFANQKGGVGKTTSAVNIAACVAALDNKVLLVDFDPQGNATSGVGISKKKITKSTYEALLGLCPAKEAVIETNFKNLSVMPANIQLSGAEYELMEKDKRDTMLKQALDQLDGQFDYIIIDCPPSLGMLTVNGLTAANGIIIPMQCEYYALEGLTQLIMTIKRIKQSSNSTLSITGILITMYNGRLNLSEQVIEELKKYYTDKIFKTPIARNIKVTEAPGFGQPLYYYDKYSKGSLAYMDVAKEYIERVN